MSPGLTGLQQQLGMEPSLQFAWWSGRLFTFSPRKSEDKLLYSPRTVPEAPRYNKIIGSASYVNFRRNKTHETWHAPPVGAAIEVTSDLRPWLQMLFTVPNPRT